MKSVHLYLNKKILFFGHVIFNFRQQKSLRQGSHNVNSMGEGAGGSGEGNGEGEGGRDPSLQPIDCKPGCFIFVIKKRSHALRDLREMPLYSLLK